MYGSGGDSGMQGVNGHHRDSPEILINGVTTRLHQVKSRVFTRVHRLKVAVDRR